jgi:hypothetical protein
MWNATAVRCNNHFILSILFQLSPALTTFVFNTHPNYQLQTGKFDPPRLKDICPILSETSAISPAEINLATRARKNCLPFLKQIANDEDKRQATQYHVHGGRVGGVTGV